MEIHGFQKLTLLDYPEHIAATVFTGGCNFRCPFCHNGDLVLRPQAAPLISEEEVQAVLRKRRGMLQGVCITGGEPTLQRDLREFILKVKELGFLIKLDTNGYRPEVLKSLLAEGLLDYVAMDVKAAPANYAAATGIPGIDVSPIQESVELLKACGIPYEFRTTVVKGIHSVDEFEEIGRLLAGSRAYYLQGFRESENLLGECILEKSSWSEQACKGQVQAAGVFGGRSLSAFDKDSLEKMANIARKYIDRVELRGVE